MALLYAALVWGIVLALKRRGLIVPASFVLYAAAACALHERGHSPSGLRRAICRCAGALFASKSVQANRVPFARILEIRLAFVEQRHRRALFSCPDA